MSLQAKEAISLSGQQVAAAAGGGIPIVTYPELGSYANWDALMAKASKGAVACLFLTTSPTSGHWTALFNSGDGAHLFDPIGMAMDSERSRVSPQELKALGETTPEYGRILSTAQKPTHVSRVDFQQDVPNINTCGRWTATRIQYREMPDADFKKMVFGACHQAGLNPDQWVTLHTSKHAADASDSDSNSNSGGSLELEHKHAAVHKYGARRDNSLRLHAGYSIPLHAADLYPALMRAHRAIIAEHEQQQQQSEELSGGVLPPFLSPDLLDKVDVQYDSNHIKAQKFMKAHHPFPFSLDPAAIVVGDAAAAKAHALPHHQHLFFPSQGTEGGRPSLPLFIDTTRNSALTTWLSRIQTGQNSNVLLVRKGNQIGLITTRDIRSGEPLLFPLGKAFIPPPADRKGKPAVIDMTVEFEPARPMPNPVQKAAAAKGKGNVIIIDEDGILRPDEDGHAPAGGVSAATEKPKKQQTPHSRMLVQNFLDERDGVDVDEEEDDPEVLEELQPIRREFKDRRSHVPVVLTVPVPEKEKPKKFKSWANELRDEQNRLPTLERVVAEVNKELGDGALDKDGIPTDAIAIWLLHLEESMIVGDPDLMRYQLSLLFFLAKHHLRKHLEKTEVNRTLPTEDERVMKRVASFWNAICQLSSRIREKAPSRFTEPTEADKDHFRRIEAVSDAACDRLKAREQRKEEKVERNKKKDLQAVAAQAALALRERNAEEYIHRKKVAREEAEAEAKAAAARTILFPPPHPEFPPTHPIWYVETESESEGQGGVSHAAINSGILSDSPILVVGQPASASAPVRVRLPGLNIPGMLFSSNAYEEREQQPPSSNFVSTMPPETARKIAAEINRASYVQSLFHSVSPEAAAAHARALEQQAKADDIKRAEEDKVLAAIRAERAKKKAADDQATADASAREARLAKEFSDAGFRNNPLSVGMQDLRNIEKVQVLNARMAFEATRAENEKEAKRAQHVRAQRRYRAKQKLIAQNGLPYDPSLVDAAVARLPSRPNPLASMTQALAEPPPSSVAVIPRREEEEEEIEIIPITRKRHRTPDELRKIALVGAVHDRKRLAGNKHPRPQPPQPTEEDLGAIREQTKRDYAALVAKSNANAVNPRIHSSAYDYFTRLSPTDLKLFFQYFMETDEDTRDMMEVSLNTDEGMRLDELKRDEVFQELVMQAKRMLIDDHAFDAAHVEGEFDDANEIQQLRPVRNIGDRKLTLLLQHKAAFREDPRFYKHARPPRMNTVQRLFRSGEEAVHHFQRANELATIYNYHHKGNYNKVFPQFRLRVLRTPVEYVTDGFVVDVPRELVRDLPEPLTAEAEPLE